jgi:hypothetical protein
MSDYQEFPLSGTALKFRTGGAMLSRLGSEQLKDDITAVLELVKNSYDADATEVKVELRIIDSEMRLNIHDNGTGMTLEDLQNKWAWLATENKIKESRSPLFKRRRLGQKLGKLLVLRTSVTGNNRVKQIKFNWEDIRADHELNYYKFPIVEKKPDPFEQIPGTSLSIRNLRTKWDTKKFETLRYQLANLIDPESASKDFSIFLFSPWENLNGKLSNPLVGKETHSIAFSVDINGMEIEEISTYDKTTKYKKGNEPEPFGPIRGRIRYFNTGLQRVERSRGGDPDADWNVGIRIFRDGFRVRPYGEPGPQGDWLQIYRTRYLKGSRFRLKPHYLEGAVHISSDTNSTLRDTTSREGLDENDAFKALVDYMQEKVAKLSEILREEEIKEERIRTQERYKHALKPLTEGLGKLKSEIYKQAVERADMDIKKQLTKPQQKFEIHNAHWECLDCKDSWKAPIEKVPIKCREYSVGRDGKPTNKNGCGSLNIKRKENIQRGDLPRKEFLDIDDVLEGIPAYVSGIQLKPIIDWEMGENDEEAEIRHEKRELAINGRHPSFRIAEVLDGKEVSELKDFEALQAVGALTIHVIDAASLAWGRWHYLKANNKIDEFLSKYSELKKSCRACILDSRSQAS